jgi:hypothetical protein
METVVKKPQKKMPSYLKPTKTSSNRKIVVPNSKTKRDNSPSQAPSRQSKMFSSTSVTPTKRSKSP